ANTVGPLTIPAQTFAETTYATWNSVVPRVGMTYDLLGTGRSVIKVNYGLYRFNPGVNLANSANQNQENKNATYQWSDRKACPGCIAGDGIYQVGEEGNQTASALAGNISVDSNLKQPYANQATAYFEQEVTEGVGARVGFAYYG